ncbi:MAG: DUF2501 domain-containing protein [Gammaproteobacteria bacterium]|nr:DUF2501 domain-containing protein [Gammaproteobacteria bacterium]MBU1439835.1 DUF2501 domain-containing protein [Gammaproteobacteria bacterium]MBU2285871.1 DUF2501 domain-containing protein [Gammaproteobacteria bacterium]MBU2408281.1 DUF2501 domain-containing protein [Gammaproteobacteria bacterium]
MNFRSTLVALAIVSTAPMASAQNQMMDALKSRLQGDSQQAAPANSGQSQGGGGAAAAALAGMGISMPAMGSSTAGNAAGVLQYCVKNNYLSADAAGGIKDKLMGMVTGNKTQQTGFNSGSNGVLQGTDGKSLNLKSIGSKLKTKACDYVLSNAKSLV